MSCYDHEVLVKFNRAESSYFEGFGLRGFLSLEVEGAPKMFAFTLPTAEDPNPPGWSTIARYVKPNLNHVLEAWDPEGRTNIAAEAALAEFTTRFHGQTFYLVNETPIPAGGTAADLELVNEPFEVPAQIQVARVAEPEPETYVACGPPDLYLPANAPAGGAAELILPIPSLSSEHWFRWRAPDPMERTPTGWWFIEALTGIAHDRIALAWKDGRNDPLFDTQRIFTQALANCAMPLRGGRPDFERFVRDVVRTRLVAGIRPFIFLGRPHDCVTLTRIFLRAGCGEYLFLSDAQAGKNKGLPALVQDVQGKPGLVIMDHPDKIKPLLVRFINYATSGHPPKYSFPPKDIAVDLLQYPDKHWPQIDGVVRIPTVRPDGSILDTPGYDPDTRLWLAPEFALEPIPEKLTKLDIERAKALITMPIQEFPFIGPQDRTAALCALFEQIVRPMISGPRPFYVFEAPPNAQGSGKTLLAKIFQSIITGDEPFVSAIGQQNEEIEKRITTYLREGHPFLILDNLKSEISSTALEQLATSPRWQARLLSTNQAPIVPQNTTWVLTLNAAKVNRDFSRRAVMCRLDSKTDKPWERTGFKLEDPVEWGRSRRGAIIRAILILVRAWVLDGMPRDTEVVRGSFESWARVMGGLMKHAGFTDLKRALLESDEREASTEDHKFLIKLWLLQHPGQLLPAAQLGVLAQTNGLYDDRLSRKKSPLAIGRAMADILEGLAGRILEGWRVAKHPALRDGLVVYELTRVS